MSTVYQPLPLIEPPPKRYRIGEIVRHTGLSRQTLHNYTAMGLIREAEWTPGGHRLYDESVFTRLARIAQLKRSRRMDEIVQLLAERDPPPVRVLDPGPRPREDDGLLHGEGAA